MTKIRFSKAKISIQNIGRQRFWTGVFAGFVSAISIALAFNYGREVFRFITGIYGSLLILAENEQHFFNLFFSALAAVLGLSVTIWIWMGNHTHLRKKDQLYKQLSGSNALLIFWVMLMLITRFGSILSITLFGRPTYDNHLNFYEDFWLLFVLMPLVVFFQNWLAVRLVYRAGKWIFISFVLCLLTTYLLNITTSVKQEKLNTAYYQELKK
ncbi:MAG: hypothetical protein R2798_14935 [Chitinophagales bacterium]|nr:hypothetical protein [Bacteroidota bacterium]